MTTLHYLSRRAVTTGAIDAARRLDPAGVTLAGDCATCVVLDDPPGVSLAGATWVLDDPPGVTLGAICVDELDPPGVTLGTDGDRALICTDELPGGYLVADSDLALGAGERVLVFRCFSGGSTLTMELGSPVMTAPLWSSG